MKFGVLLLLKNTCSKVFLLEKRCQKVFLPKLFLGNFFRPKFSRLMYRKLVAKLNGVVWYGLKNGTDLWQPVDAGYAEKLKTMIKHSFFDWLDDDENADKWNGVENFTASEQQILLTKCIGNAYRKLTNSKWDSFRLRLLKKPCVSSLQTEVGIIKFNRKGWKIT